MFKKIATLSACAFILMTLYSCGGGGGQATSTLTITRSNDKSFSMDAKALDARIAVGPWLPADKAAVFDADLARIRARYPQLANIHTVGDYTLNDMQIAVKLDAPWRVTWDKGTLTTGDPSVDRALTTYGAATVRPMFVYDNYEWFSLTFNVSLNTRGLVSIFKSASDSIVIAEADAYIGDGDNITFAKSNDHNTYVFSHGWGDCSAGCIERHSWTVNIALDGSMAIVESGTPIPPDGGRGYLGANVTRLTITKIVHE